MIGNPSEEKSFAFRADICHLVCMVVLPFTPVLPAAKLDLVSCPPFQHRPSAPVTVPILANERLTPPDYVEDIRHVVFDLRGTDFSFAEGQSIGILAPGIAADGKPHRLRLFSIASPREGEPDLPGTMAVCVKRLVFKNREHELRLGICSNYLCDLLPGETVRMSGPNGKHFALPRSNDTDLLFFATGTGIGPYRGFLMSLFRRPESYTGNVRLFYGSRTLHDQVYANDTNADISQWDRRPGFNLHPALSREDTSRRVHIGDVMSAEREDIEEILDRQNYAVYICGIKGMEKEVENFFRSYVEVRTGESPDDGQWAQMKEQLRLAGRWIQEVY